MGNTKMTRHQKKYTIVCDWCGERKETSREDTKTCGDVCRKRMSFYRATLGYDPDQPPGPFTGQAAVDLEVFRLITNERRRREAAAAYLRATGKLPPRDA